MKIPTPQFLEQRKAIILSDLKMKIEAEDWHGVADAAMDLREIEAQAKMIDLAPKQQAKPCDHDWRYYIVTGTESCQICGAQREPVTDVFAN